MGKGGALRRWGWDCPIRGGGIPSGPPPLGQPSGRPCGTAPHRAPPRPVSLPAGAWRPGPLRWPQDAALGIADAGAFLPSGRSLVLALRRVGRMGGGGSALRVCAEHRGGINWLSLSPDGQRLLTGSEDGTARLWSTADGQCCALLQGRPCRAQPSASGSVFSACSPASDLGSHARRPHPQSPNLKKNVQKTTKKQNLKKKSTEN